jgi:hypothetical protein
LFYGGFRHYLLDVFTQSKQTALGDLDGDSVVAMCTALLG